MNCCFSAGVQVLAPYTCAEPSENGAGAFAATGREEGANHFPFKTAVVRFSLFLITSQSSSAKDRMLSPSGAVILLKVCSSIAISLFRELNINIFSINANCNVFTCELLKAP